MMEKRLKSEEKSYRPELEKTLETVIERSEGKNILLAGPWGSGKTYLLKKLKKTLESEGKWHVIYFSPWSAVVDGDPRRTFWETIDESLSSTLSSLSSFLPLLSMEYHGRRGADKVWRKGLGKLFSIEVKWQQAASGTCPLTCPLPWRKELGKLFSIEVDKIRLQRWIRWIKWIKWLINFIKSSSSIRVMVWHGGVYLAEDNRILLLRQWRKGLGKFLKYDLVQYSLGMLIRYVTVDIASVAITTGKDVAEKLAETCDDSVKEKTQIEDARAMIREMLSSIKKVTGKKLLLLVDDLDRTLPDKAIQVLEELYHLFMVHNSEPFNEEEKNWPLTSIWAINTTVLEEYLCQEYREVSSFDPNAYLEKIFCLRISVPPIMQLSETSKSQEVPKDLWEESLATNKDVLSTEEIGRLVEKLNKDVNYAILGNFRLFKRIRNDCTNLWKNRLWRTTLWINKRDLECFIRYARLIVLIDAFPFFREHIAPYNGMWPPFLNRVNKQFNSLECIAHPKYRHVDSPDLATLLCDLEAINDCGDLGYYTINERGREKLQKDLGELWGIGL